LNKFELTALYEFSSQEVFTSYEPLFDDLVAKASRIFSARRIVLEVKGRRIFSWGFGRQKPRSGERLESSHPVYERFLGQDLGRIWLEKATPFQDFEMRLLDIYFRQVENSLHAVKRSEELATANERFLKVVENTPFVAIHGFDQEGKILYWNKAAEHLYGFAKEEVLGRKIGAGFIGSQLQRMFRESLDLNRTFDHPRVVESMVSTRSGDRRTALSFVFPLGGEQGALEFIRMDVDISDRKRMERQLRFNSLHDRLTGLYNRNFFEQEMERLERAGRMPAGIVVCDLDGLKLVNDTLGHQAGDRLLVSAAIILKSLFCHEESIARIGGDEFAILFPAADPLAVLDAAQRIRDSVEDYNRAKPDLPISISVGCAVKDDSMVRAGELFREADNNMYREKLHRSQSNRSAVVQTLTRALEARDFITEGHADRIEALVVAMAVELGLSKHRISDLRLLAKFHDIGKVGIKDHILFKPGSLTPEEARAMRRHCEIGYRIAQASPDLAPVADWIFRHHEWWDGSGYPLGLKGEEAPLECRILAIADAFDAMTSDRPYRKALTCERAVAELERCAGIQFDPALVARFIKVLEKVSPGKAQDVAASVLSQGRIR
jgi:diguanylate cyclase (GGDEF)-like protein/PAS domain S-box-containing protein